MPPSRSKIAATKGYAGAAIAGSAVAIMFLYSAFAKSAQVLGAVSSVNTFVLYTITPDACAPVGKYE
ncbi:hypothetical protein D3C78_1534200 [compost metagenome]